MPEPRWVTLGRAVRAHGVRGELRVVLEVEDATELLVPGLRLRALRRDGSTENLTLAERVRPIHGAVLMTLKERTQREDVQLLAGSTLQIDGSLLPESEEPYLFELDDAVVENEAGERLGILERVADNGGQELLVFTTSAGEERMLPLVDETFVRFDRDRAVLVVRPIPGLWDDT